MKTSSIILQRQRERERVCKNMQYIKDDKTYHRKQVLMKEILKGLANGKL